MPRTDARTGLPRQVLTAVWDATFHVPEQALLLVVVEDFSHHNDILLTVVGIGALVVVVRQDVIANLIVAVVERQDGVVEVDGTGMILVDALQHTVLELLLVGLRRQ